VPNRQLIERQEGILELILRQLERRIGEIAPELQSRIRQ
jgi:hypothetical protein